jgi:hypothetical protein
MNKKIEYFKRYLKGQTTIQIMSNRFQELIEPIMGEYFEHGRVDTKHKTTSGKTRGNVDITIKPVWKANCGANVEVYLDDGSIVVERLISMSLPADIKAIGLGDPEMVDKVRAAIGRWINI